MHRRLAPLPPFLGFLLASAGVLATGGTGTAMALAVVCLAIATLSLVTQALLHAGGAQASLAHARRSIDVSVPLAQSDPGAPGHPRPRAPGIPASAA